jgi:hypothetical protein
MKTIEPIDTDAAFRARHPFVLNDGRRFASLFCAASSALADGQLPIVHAFTKQQFDIGECRTAICGPIPAAETRDLSVPSAYRYSW